MKLFKKLTPLFLAAGFAFASAPAFSQFQFASTTIPECDQYLQAYGVDIKKSTLETFPNMTAELSKGITMRINRDLKEESKKIRDKIERGTMLGIPIIQKLKAECKEELDLINSRD